MFSIVFLLLGGIFLLWKYNYSFMRSNEVKSKLDAIGIEENTMIKDSVQLSKLQYEKAYELYKNKAYVEARSVAREAIALNSSNGKAYALIGTMYQKSANDCGTDALSKRMVYVAAVDKLEQAIKVDSSLNDRLSKLITSYKSQYPSKALFFTNGKKSGDSIQIGCWIGETVIVP